MSESLILGTRIEGDTIVQERLRGDGLIETHRNTVLQKGKGVTVRCGDIESKWGSVRITANTVEVEPPWKMTGRTLTGDEVDLT